MNRNQSGTSKGEQTGNFRILVIDDNADIHDDFRAALLHAPARTHLSELEGLLFRDRPDADPIPATSEPCWNPENRPVDGSHSIARYSVCRGRGVACETGDIRE